MPVFEFTKTHTVKVEAKERWIAEAALEYYCANGRKGAAVDFGVLGAIEVVEGEGFIEPKPAPKAKKAPPEGQKAPPEKKSEEKPPQSEVKDACAICYKDIEPGQPIQEIATEDGITFYAHSVCAAAGGAT